MNTDSFAPKLSSKMYSMPSGLNHFDSPLNRKIPKRKTFFNPAWEQKLDGVRRSIRGETHFFCMYCQKDYNISSMGITAVTAHQSTPRHQKNVEACKSSLDSINLDAFKCLDQTLGVTDVLQSKDVDQPNNSPNQNSTLKTKKSNWEIAFQSLRNSTEEVDVKPPIPLIEQLLAQTVTDDNEHVECQAKPFDNENVNESRNELSQENQECQQQEDNTNKIIENSEINERGRKRLRIIEEDEEESSDDGLNTQQNLNGSFLALEAAKMRYYTAQANLAESKCLLINEQIALTKAQREESEAHTALLRLQFKQQKMR
ncbi:hypothetical protein ACQ4LE_000320 [Meloidogyne hapla]|uniref:Coiled-coil domain-containing protein 16 n=1 Tax=Meloidogyne hapla TaxID=6305 RepID=A0A1I8B0Y2_MELHA